MHIMYNKFVYVFVWLCAFSVVFDFERHATDFALTLDYIGYTISTRIMSLYLSVKILLSKKKKMQCV